MSEEQVQTRPVAGSEEPRATSKDRVLVGVDGSDRDDFVIQIAAREAALRGWGLHIVHVTPFVIASMGNVPLAPIGDTEYSNELLAHATDVADRLGLGVHVTSESIPGRPENVIHDLSEEVGLLVTGTGRKSAAGMFFFGTVSLNAAAHGGCPVLVVGEAPRDPVAGRVMVAVDGSDHSRAALALAVGEARMRKAELVIHTAWSFEVIDGVVVTEPGSEKWLEVEANYRQMQDRMLAAVLGEGDDITVSHVIAQGGVVDTLVAASAGADLLVVGNRGRGGFRGKLLGSVTMGLLKRAQCPVLVTRAR